MSGLKKNGSDIADAQARVLDAIVGHQKEHGKPPTIKELSTKLERAQSTTSYHVTVLKNAGYIESDKANNRAVGKVLKEKQVKGVAE